MALFVWKLIEGLGPNLSGPITFSDRRGELVLYVILVLILILYSAGPF